MQARAIGKSSLAVVGSSKNAGKSVVVAALAETLGRSATAYGLCSIGRDGEASDALSGALKPRFRLPAGAAFATAAAFVPRSPACEILAATAERCALGPIVLARMRAAGYVEVAGPPSAAALRRIAGALGRLGAFVLIDGAVDRSAALRGGDDAVVVAVGAASAPTMAHAAQDAAALVARLRLPLVDPQRPALDVPGGLTAAVAALFVRADERRQIVVPDATHVAFGGRAYLEIARRLDLRCRVALHPIACTVASQSLERTFEPRAFARLVAERTALPTYDVYAASMASVSGNAA